MSVNSQKYLHLQEYVQGLKVKDVRTLFAYFRKLSDENPNILFPAYGITASEFAVMYIQNMAGKGKKAREEHAGDLWEGNDAMDEE